MQRIERIGYTVYEFHTITAAVMTNLWYTVLL